MVVVGAGLPTPCSGHVINMWSRRKHVVQILHVVHRAKGQASCRILERPSDPLYICNAKDLTTRAYDLKEYVCFDPSACMAGATANTHLRCVDVPQRSCVDRWIPDFANTYTHTRAALDPCTYMKPKVPSSGSTKFDTIFVAPRGESASSLFTPRKTTGPAGDM